MTEVELQISFNAEEATLMVELLNRELAHLPAEIHHTRTRSVRDDLKQRMSLIERILARFPNR